MKDTELNDEYFRETPAIDRFTHKNPLVRFIERHRVGTVVRVVGYGGKLLEMGCEACGLIDRCNASEKFGMDISGEALENAPKHIKLVLGDARNSPFEGGYFDTVILAETLEHVKDPENMIKETKRVLKKGGRLVVTVPYETHITNVKKILKKIGLMKIFFRGIPEDTSPYHVQFFTPKSIRKLVARDLKVEKVWVGPFPIFGPIIFLSARKT